MKYFSFTTNGELDVQVLHNGVNGDFLLEKNIYNKFNKEEVKDLLLVDNVKKTDVLVTGDLALKGMIISSKCYDLLKAFRLHDIQFIDIKATGLNGYKFMFFNGDLTANVDYISSNFKLYKYSIIKKKFEEIVFAVEPNRESIIKIDIDIVSRSATKKIFPSNGYKFKKDFKMEDFDIFRIGHYDLNFYVSEKVKNALEENKITGCEFIEQKML